MASSALEGYDNSLSQGRGSTSLPEESFLVGDSNFDHTSRSTGATEDGDEESPTERLRSNEERSLRVATSWKR
eukprot:CAMPEP_0181230496 /NCGR_PEP_ID=MMETSP1096-20121128/34508_1 /TAXON_ID=156174 ORGANISM="Chrysochromulina ericina, Strain CCMP281" /NCGR_SAMPLE_ID=MMETSP1096 /ASSEMBLY_ACC=CAM_ASM_000453 /LENGTH=72 /DNA_ID=CAMNT_0023324283 /DNA_START=84 /DNA_END=298 /DNA_ORIENTATION=-